MQVRSFMSGFSPITLSSMTATGLSAETNSKRTGKLHVADVSSPDPRAGKSLIKDLLDLSESALQASDSATEPAAGKAWIDKTAATKASGNQTTGELSEEEEELVEELSERDKEVRAHEMAHLTAAGTYATGGPTYSYQVGPDGQKYAVGGEVQIDTSPVEGDPEATAEKARVVRNAALAPAEPSAQDRRVAANATKLEQQAIAEISEQKRREVSGESEKEEAQPGLFLDLIA